MNKVRKSQKVQVMNETNEYFFCKNMAPHYKRFKGLSKKRRNKNLCVDRKKETCTFFYDLSHIYHFFRIRYLPFMYIQSTICKKWNTRK